jgi:hypothetical protein
MRNGRYCGGRGTAQFGAFSVPVGLSAGSTTFAGLWVPDEPPPDEPPRCG